MLIGIASTYFAWGEMAAAIERASPQSTTSTSMVAVVIMLSFFASISIAFWYAIARRASKIAKWIYVIWMGLGSISTLTSLSDPTGFKGAALVASLVSTALTIASIVCLFRPDAVAWFARKGRSDASVFD
jgi:hypothetical protein